MTEISGARRPLIILAGGLGAFTIVAWATLARFAWTSGASMFEIGALAYFLGLRHGFDADHVAAIDNVTRKLRLEGSRTITTGLYFALGHSTIVILMTLALVMEGSRNPNNWILSGFRQHAILGMIVSAAFLTVIGLANLMVFSQLWRALHARGARKSGEIDSILERRGLIARMFFFVYRRIDASWKMYPVGFLFGLGFDTATEIALLAIAAEAAVRGRFPLAAIMLLPILFTAGMTLVDALDGALMMRIYDWASSDVQKKLFFNMSITGVTVAVALLIAAVEWLQVVSVGFQLDGAMWRALDDANSSETGLLTAALIAALWLVGWRRYRRHFAAVAERRATPLDNAGAD